MSKRESEVTVMECGVENIWDDWKTVRLLGEGSFGKVYEIVRDLFGLEERSAVKIIGIPSSPAEVQSLKSDGMTMDNITDYYEGVVRDFVQEITLMSKLRGHTNIVGYEDYKVVKRPDSFGWDIYIRMELLTSLTAHMEAMQGADPDATVSVNGKTVRVFDETDVVKMAIDMCSALEVCYARHIVHRDIKPDNIFVSADGNYKLGDFGVAKTVEKTVSGLSKKGTPTYMAPEIYKGEPGGMNSDIYSLGIVMYKLLNDNREPFLPPFPEAVKYEHKQQALARRMNGDVPPRPKKGSEALWDIVKKACACDAAKRWQNPTDLKQALAAVLQNDEVKQTQEKPLAPKPAPPVDETIAVRKTTQAEESTTNHLTSSATQSTTVQQATISPVDDAVSEETVDSLKQDSTPLPLDTDDDSGAGSPLEQKEPHKIWPVFLILGLLLCVVGAVIGIVHSLGKDQQQDTAVEQASNPISDMDETKGYFYNEGNVPALSDQGVRGDLKEAYYTKDGGMSVTLNLSNGTPKEMEVTFIGIRVFNDKDETIAQDELTADEFQTKCVVAPESYGEVCCKIDKDHVVKADDSLQILGMTWKIDCVPTDGSTYEAPAVDAYRDTIQVSSDVAVGDVVTFGTYEQDDNIYNGVENIDWIVLDKQDGKALVVSKYALDCQQYNEEYTNVTWETCTLRKWLNNEFLNTAFSQTEQTDIVTTTVQTADNEMCGTDGGNNTQDKVFLLSIDEAAAYFADDAARECEATAYAENQGTVVNRDNRNCWWWLRSPGFDQYSAASVVAVGGVSVSGYDVDRSNRAVRPALWITME